MKWARVCLLVLLTTIGGCGGRSADDDFDAGGAKGDAAGDSFTKKDAASDALISNDGAHASDAADARAEGSNDPRDANSRTDSSIDPRDANPDSDARIHSPDAGQAPPDAYADALRDGGEPVDASSESDASPPERDAVDDGAPRVDSIADSPTSKPDSRADAADGFCDPDVGCALVSIAVTPIDPVVVEGTIFRLQATGIYADGTTSDLTKSAIWFSTVGAIAGVSGEYAIEGLVTAMRPGTVRIEAHHIDIIGATTVTVVAAEPVSLEIAPPMAKMAVNTTRSFSAVLAKMDGSTEDVTSTATWSSSNAAVASVGGATGSPGLATALGAGSTTITAMYGGFSVSTRLDVTASTLSRMSVAVATSTMSPTTSQRLIALGVFSDGSEQDLTTQANWSSSDPARATVDDSSGMKGVVRAVSAGPVTMTASYGGLSSGEPITVSSATLNYLENDPPGIYAVLRMLHPFRAIGVFSDGSKQDVTLDAAFSSRNPIVARLRGNVARGETQGEAEIDSTFGRAVGSSTMYVMARELVSIAVTPASASVAVGERLPLDATGRWDGPAPLNLPMTADVLWSSSNPAVAAVANAPGSKGSVTGLSAGKVTIGASFGGVSSSIEITVTGIVNAPASARRSRP